MLVRAHQENGVEGPAQNAGQNRGRLPEGIRQDRGWRRLWPGSEKLSGREGFRLSTGQYRAIYTHEAEVIVIDAGPRGDIYK
jgi:hypothetical protein